MRTTSQHGSASFAITITACAGDGRVFSSKVCLAMAPAVPEKAPSWADDHVLVTPEAQERLRASEIWHHLGGWSDEGDTYDTQAAGFEEELDRFWMNLVSSDERLRQSIMSAVRAVDPPWQSVKVFSKGKVRIRFNDHTVRILREQHPNGPSVNHA